MQATLRTSTGTTQRPTSSKSPSRSTLDYLLIMGKYLQHILQRSISWSQFGRIHNSIIDVNEIVNAISCIFHLPGGITWTLWSRRWLTQWKTCRGLLQSRVFWWLSLSSTWLPELSKSSSLSSTCLYELFKVIIIINRVIIKLDTLPMFYTMLRITTLTIIINI